jgi:selenocysteine lyase/cysteine desulfurase
VLLEGLDRKRNSLPSSVLPSRKLTNCVWLEMLGDSGIVKPAKLENLLSEATQLVAILTASRNTAREN